MRFDLLDEPFKAGIIAVLASDCFTIIDQRCVGNVEFVVEVLPTTPDLVFNRLRILQRETVASVNGNSVREAD